MKTFIALLLSALAASAQVYIGQNWQIGETIPPQVSSGGTTANIPVVNYSFELPVLSSNFGGGGVPTGWWNTNCCALMCADGETAWLSAPAQAGVQYAGVQDIGDLSTFITNTVSGEYVVSFYAAGRNLWTSYADPMALSLDGIVQTNWSASQFVAGAWNQYTVACSISTGVHILTFQGLGVETGSGALDTMLDDVTITPAP